MGQGDVPPLLHIAGHWGTVSRRTTDKKLTKLYWPLQKRSPKRLIVLVEPKKVEGHDQKNFSVPPPLSLRTGGPNFQIPSGATNHYYRSIIIMLCYVIIILSLLFNILCSCVAIGRVRRAVHAGPSLWGQMNPVWGRWAPLEPLHRVPLQTLLHQLILWCPSMLNHI